MLLLPSCHGCDGDYENLRKYTHGFCAMLIKCNLCVADLNN